LLFQNYIAKTPFIFARPDKSHLSNSSSGTESTCTGYKLRPATERICNSATLATGYETPTPQSKLETVGSFHSSAGLKGDGYVQFHCLFLCPSLRSGVSQSIRSKATTSNLHHHDRARRLASTGPPPAATARASRAPRVTLIGERMPVLGHW